jgi:glutathione synthase/RimK-type ligase-like ATP-grasp enzyme
MSKILLVVDRPERWPLHVPEIEILSVRNYLTDSSLATRRNLRVFNLCRSYRYQSSGYYVSLLAEARGHKPIPSASTIQDMKTQSLIRVLSAELDDLIQKNLQSLQSDKFTLSIYFSRNLARKYDRLCRALFNLFPVPLLRVNFQLLDKHWQLQSITPIASNEIPEEHRSFVIEAAREYFSGKVSPISRKPARYRIAILVNPEGPFPPSNDKAIRRFIRAAEQTGFQAELIQKEDYGRLAEFDALFIRETTAVNHHTFRFARKAEAEGLVVLDDPRSILRCTNKVFLAEILDRYKVPSPKTRILHKDNLMEVIGEIGYPCILKQPDSAFSQGVVKVSDKDDYLKTATNLLEKSELLIAQEFIPTAFDWRIGILEGKPLYACKYYMARKHWQIYHHAKQGADATGRVECVPVELVPRHVMRAAQKAAQLMGDGLYGVDLKDTEDGCKVIEVNDNPSIDGGLEDSLVRENLYLRVMEYFMRRVREHRDAHP